MARRGREEGKEPQKVDAASMEASVEASMVSTISAEQYPLSNIEVKASMVSTISAEQYPLSNTDLAGSTPQTLAQARPSRTEVEACDDASTAPCPSLTEQYPLGETNLAGSKPQSHADGHSGIIRDQTATPITSELVAGTTSQSQAPAPPRMVEGTRRSGCHSRGL